MRFSKVFPVAVALGSNIALAQRDSDCEDITISSNNPSIDCEVITGDVTVDDSVVGELAIEGPEQIRGDLIVRNATQLVSLTSSTLNAIGGSFELQGLSALSTLQMSALRSINEILFISLPSLTALTFGSEGITRASNVRISDTRLGDLSGLKLASVDSFRIDNNDHLVRFSSDLVNVTDFLEINANGNANGDNNMTVSMLNLETAARISINGVGSFEVPSLERMTGSLTFDRNPALVSFTAPNLTQVATAITFTTNRELTNISFPELESISAGALTIIENAELTSVDGFPKLTRIAGGMQLAGNFESADFPELEIVSGTVNVTSSTQDTSFCDSIEALGSAVQGELNCEDNREDAVSEENGGTGSSGNGSSGGSSGDDEDDDNAAGIIAVNMAILAVAGIAGLVQLL